MFHLALSFFFFNILTQWFGFLERRSIRVWPIHFPRFQRNLSLVFSYRCLGPGDKLFLYTSLQQNCTTFRGWIEYHLGYDNRCTIRYIPLGRQERRTLVQMDWATLTDPVLLNIYSYLSPREIICAGATCKQWNRVSYDNILWRNKFRAEHNLERHLKLGDRFVHCLLPERIRRTKFHTLTACSRSRYLLVRWI